jgi:DNA-binding MarR family transcriptional regulator
VARQREASPFPAEFLLAALHQLGRRELTFTQLVAMHYVADREEATVGEVAAAIGRSRAATSRLLDALVRAGLATREESYDDRRMRRVRLTRVANDFLGGLQRGHRRAARGHARPPR